MKLFMTFAACLALGAAPLHAQTNDLVAKSKRGKQLMAAGRFEEAIPIYRDLVVALPDNPGPVMDLGLALHMAGHEREAAGQFQAVLKLKPADLPARLFLGAAYVGLQEPTKAIEPLTTVVRAQPHNKDARLILGEALLSLERFQPASEQFARLSELDPDNPKAWNGLGLSYEGLASRSFETLEKLAPESAYWLVLVAEARAKAEQYSRAFFFYREALAKMPRLHGVHVAVAEIYRKTGHPDWAIMEEEKERKLPPVKCTGFEVPKTEFRTARTNAAPLSRHERGNSPQELECAFWAGRYHKVINENSQNAEGYYWRIRACNELARQAFSQLAQLPPSAEVEELLAKIHFSQKSYAASAKNWEEALKFSPGNPYYEQGLAVSLSAGTKYESARPLLESLLKQSPDSWELNYWLGYTLLGLEKPEEAVPYLERAVGLDPTLLQAQRDLARAYLRVGELERAILHLKAALPLDDDGSLYYQLAQAYRRAGQRELEREMLAKFRQIQGSASVEKKNLEKALEITPP